MMLLWLMLLCGQWLLVCPLTTCNKDMCSCYVGEAINKVCCKFFKMCCPEQAVENPEMEISAVKGGGSKGGGGPRVMEFTRPLPISSRFVLAKEALRPPPKRSSREQVKKRSHRA